MSAPNQEIASSVREFLLEHALYDQEPGFELRDGQSLTGLGVVDSLIFLNLLTHLETAFGVKIAEDEIQPKNFDSVDRIVAFVAGKLG